jgi:hypothetical protein
MYACIQISIESSRCFSKISTEYSVVRGGIEMDVACLASCDCFGVGLLRKFDVPLPGGSTFPKRLRGGGGLSQVKIVEGQLIEKETNKCKVMSRINLLGDIILCGVLGFSPSKPRRWMIWKTRGTDTSNA